MTKSKKVKKKQCIFSKREQHKEEIKSPTHLIMHRCLFNILVADLSSFYEVMEPCQGCVLLTVWVLEQEMFGSGDGEKVSFLFWGFDTNGFRRKTPT